MKGSCLCQAVKYQINTTPKDPGCCHCNQCRKQSGHFWAAAFVEDSNLVVSGEVRWYSSSEEAKRGFCPICGSVLFWKYQDGDSTAFSLGSLDGETGIRLEQHIFTAFKGDYYDITDGLPQHGIVEGVS